MQSTYWGVHRWTY